MSSQRKRFIASAVCPKCKAQDRIVSYTENDIALIECVECGFKQSEQDLSKPKPAEVTIKWPTKKSD
jgi:uncharacterized metal-binding protein (TIGR02443 family)